MRLPREQAPQVPAGRPCAAGVRVRGRAGHADRIGHEVERGARRGLGLHDLTLLAIALRHRDRDREHAGDREREQRQRDHELDEREARLSSFASTDHDDGPLSEYRRT